MLFCLQDGLQEYTYVVFAVILAGSVVFIFFFVPETKNKTFDEIANSIAFGRAKGQTKNYAMAEDKQPMATSKVWYNFMWQQWWKTWHQKIQGLKKEGHEVNWKEWVQMLQVNCDMRTYIYFKAAWFDNLGIIILSIYEIFRFLINRF